jgi:hypothetical protein
VSRTVAERVAAGAAWLDEHDPGWWRKDSGNAINLKALDLADTTACILGQRCPVERFARSASTPFDAQLRYITRGKGVWSSLWDWAVQHGFMAGGDRPDYPPLTREWRTVIKKRRAGAS